MNLSRLLSADNSCNRPRLHAVYFLYNASIQYMLPRVWKHSTSRIFFHVVAAILHLRCQKLKREIQI